MADFTVSVTVPDDKLSEFVDALHWHFGEKEEGVPYTNGELKGLLDNATYNAWKDIFKRYKRHLKAQEAVDDDISIGT